MIIAVDIGATNLRVASFAADQPDSHIDTTKFETPQEYAALYERLAQTIRQLAGDQKIDAISIGAPGLVAPDHRSLVRSAFLPAMGGKPIADSLEQEFATKVLLNNDAVCSALGESYFGVGKNGSRILYVTISTGMGGAFIKKTDNTTYIMPAEIGHTIVDLHGKICECGQKGCIGAYAHGRGLEERFLTKPENIDDMRIWEEVSEYLTIGVVNGVRIFMPDTVVFSGAIVENRDYVLKKIKQMYEKRSILRPMPEMEKGSLGDNSVLFGALAFLQIKNVTFI